MSAANTNETLLWKESTMNTSKLCKQRRLGYQALEARELMYGENISATPEVGLLQDNQPAAIASATPQVTSQELNQEAISIYPRLDVDKIQPVAFPTDTVDWSGVLPRLSSNPAAPATIYLDFNGHSEASWWEHSNIEVPKFDIDHDPNGYSAAENLMIQNVWARVAEDFAPFNINVTTVDPGSFENGEALRIAIGGYWHDWYGEAAGGVGLRNAFTNDYPNVAFVWSGSQNYWAEAYGQEARLAQWIADAATHEAGHSLGLDHQSKFRMRNGIYAKAEEYREGTSWKGPIMGSTSYSDRSTWALGTVGDAGTTPPLIQDDMGIIAGTRNGFGYRADDHGDALRNATVLPWDTTYVSGILEQTSDADIFRFDTNGGQITIDLDVARFGANLDARIELWGSAPQVSTRTFSTLSSDSANLLNTPRLLASSDPADALDASITKSVDAGTYYVKVLSHGEYGDVGQYTLGGDLNLKQIIKNPVNGADFMAWQRGFGMIDAKRTDGDADGDLDVDGDDLALWQRQFSETTPVVDAISSPIAEPLPVVEPSVTFQTEYTAAFKPVPAESLVSRSQVNPVIMTAAQSMNLAATPHAGKSRHRSTGRGTLAAPPSIGPSDVSLGGSLTAPRQEPLKARAFTERSAERFQVVWHALPEQNHDLASDDFASVRADHSTKTTRPVDAAFAQLAVDERFAGLRFASPL
jgi:hypothetical protein